MEHARIHKGKMKDDNLEIVTALTPKCLQGGLALSRDNPVEFQRFSGTTPAKFTYTYGKTTRDPIAYTMGLT